MSEQNLIQLEMKVAYLEDLVLKLNSAAADQQRQIDDLKRSQESVSGKLRDLIELAAEERQSGERPPHY